MRPIKLCSLEFLDTVRVRNGLVDELTLRVFRRRYGHVVHVHSGKLNPDASFEQHLFVTGG